MQAGSLHVIPANAMLSNSIGCVVTSMKSASQVVLHACYKQQGWCMHTMHCCDKIKHRRMTHFDAGALYVLYLGELSFHQHSGGACCLHCRQHCIFICNAVPLYILWLQSSHAQIIVYLGFGAKHNNESTSQFCKRACQTVVK